MEEWSQSLKPLVERVRHFMRTTGLEVAHEFAKWNISMEVLGSAGFLPHHTTPFQAIAECAGDIEEVRSRLFDYYTDNWQDIRPKIESRLSDYNIDAEAKETFHEALTAHESGLYRCVSRVLFPEVERLFRAELFDNKVGKIGYGKIIKELMANKGIKEFMPGGLYELTMFRHLMKALAKQEESESDKRIYGLYQDVGSEEDRERLQQDPVPNRHAAIHGLVVYSSQQNSLNMIFMADYIFSVISGLRENSAG